MEKDVIKEKLADARDKRRMARIGTAVFMFTLIFWGFYRLEQASEAEMLGFIVGIIIAGLFWQGYVYRRYENRVKECIKQLEEISQEEK